MVRRIPKEAVEEIVDEPEQEEEELEQEPEPEQQARGRRGAELPAQILRTCISCGSTANLFKTKNHKTCIECCNLRPKKTEKQLEAFSKARERRMENIGKRKQTIQELEDKAREELDRKIISKAISIKKKQIKKNAELDEISDDDTPLEEVIQIAKKPRKQRPTQVAEPEPKKRQTQPRPEPRPEPVYQPPQQPQGKSFKFL